MTEVAAVTSRSIVRVAAGLAAAMAVFGVASWAPYAHYMAGMGRSASSWLQTIHVIAAVIWVAIALAFLARGGEGPLKSAPRLLVNVLCWYALVSTALDLLSRQTLPPGAWRVAFVILSVLILGFGIAAMRMTSSPSLGPQLRR